MGKNRVPVDAIRDAMIYFIKERNISVPVVLKTVDISRSRLYDYLQGNGKVSATTLVNLLMTIGVSFDELMLHIYMNNPELLDPAIKELGLDAHSVTMTPTEDTVYRTLSMYDETRDVRLLVNLVRAINSQVVDEVEKYRLIEMVRPTIVKLLSSREFYTANDMLMFANIIRHEPYNAAKLVVKQMSDQARRMASLEGFGLMELDNFSSAEVRNVALLHFQLLIMALENKDDETVRNTLMFVREYRLPALSTYFGFVKKMAQVVELSLADDDEAAEALWNQATESAKFLVDERFWPIYSFIARRSYSEFSIPVLSYRQHINEGK